MDCITNFATSIQIILSALAAILAVAVLVFALVGIKQYRELAESKADLERATTFARDAACSNWTDYGLYNVTIGQDGIQAVECRLTKDRRGPYVAIFSQARGTSSYNYQVTDRFPNRFVCHIERVSSQDSQDSDEVSGYWVAIGNESHYDPDAEETPFTGPNRDSAG